MYRKFDVTGNLILHSALFDGSKHSLIYEINHIRGACIVTGSDDAAHRSWPSLVAAFRPVASRRRLLPPCSFRWFIALKVLFAGLL
jgi:hypothetical protein